MTREVMQQALVTLENVNPSLVCEMAHHPKKDQHGIGQKCPLEIRHLETIAAIKEVLAQQSLPVQEPVIFYRCKGCNHAYEGIPPSSCDCMEKTGFTKVEYFTAPPPPVQEPPQYSLKAHWTDDKRIGVVACVTRPDGGVHLMQTIIDPPLPVQRCALCNYQHGHQIGCKNNPVDIALANLAQPPTASRRTHEH